MTVLYPQSIIKLNGQSIPFDSWRVENNVHSTADSFDVVLVKQALDKLTLSEYLFYTSDDVFIEIYFGFGSRADAPITEKSMKLMITGFVDSLEWDFREDQVKLNGRDKTSLLLENKVSEKFNNQTVEQVIKKYGAKRGLTVEIDPKVIGHTKKVGKISNGEQSLVVDNITEWDVLSRLAREEGREIFVAGNKLIYRNPLAPENRKYLKFTWGVDLEDLTVERKLKNAKGLGVKVRSWNHHQKRINSYTASANTDYGRQKQLPRNYSLRKPHSKGYESEYVMNLPGLTSEQVHQEATKRVKEINLHEIVVKFKAPISTDYNMDQVIFIDNVPIVNKQHFLPKTLTTSFDSSNGGVTEFTCVNNLQPKKGKGA